MTAESIHGVLNIKHSSIQIIISQVNAILRKKSFSFDRSWGSGRAFLDLKHIKSSPLF